MPAAALAAVPPTPQEELGEHPPAVLDVVVAAFDEDRGRRIGGGHWHTAGTGIESKLAIAWLVAFFPIVVDTAAGLQSTPPALIELARSLKASWWQIFSKVKLPARTSSGRMRPEDATSLAESGFTSAK